MPGREHEIPLRLVQNQPAMAPALLESLGFDIPHHTEAVNTSSVLTNCDPRELNSDGAVLLRDGDRNVLAIVVERQNGRDAEKRLTWPAYLTTLHTRLECPTMLVVLCPTDALARWCAAPIRTGHPGFDLAPLTIGPSAMPLIVDGERARELPELAVLSARAHGDDDPRTLNAVVEALNNTASRNRAFYYDYVLAGLNEAARKELEGLMSVETYQWQSDFARKYVGIGREEGREEGRVVEATRNVVSILQARGFSLPEATRERIESCTDLETLEKWVPLAVTADRPEDLFD
ncbi:hypothetical protein GCM10007079_09680 [Nocardiopsis terrae]|uniref:DUF4365 domain-containing protein n=1 Tax=Nocardiopsis terrae TaxID=372655 RepID=A0ABR9HCR0_9ACTN|nr:hypothetical protein [Nocardiopsis terrae]MBE1456817.1 hypothetical protein [Nocardiopsis terrae]GHC74965.1 hypothetical protein GCM10007079_09680 [Nocardiopsis terrae]